MSSRNQSLYRQLDDLLPQLERILIESLIQEAGGKHSTFISRLMDNFFMGRRYEKPEVEEAEDIANNVLRLKETLGEPLEDGATGVVLRYAELKEKRIHLYGADRVSFAKARLSDLSVEHAASLSESSLSRRSTNDDRISTPTKGRFFPVNSKEAIKLIKELDFKHSDFYQRIDLHLINPDANGAYGTKIATFYPSEVLILYSLPDGFPEARAKALTITAMRELSRIVKDVTFTWSRQKSTSYRAYLSDQNHLTLTQRKTSVTATKYRSEAGRFGHRFNAKGIKSDETVLSRIEVIAD